MRYTPVASIPQLANLLDPRRLLHWVWLGRAVVVCSILLAATVVWRDADPLQTLIATLAFAVAASVTAASAIYVDIYGKPVGRFFFVVQSGLDLLLVTAVVHITGGWSSQFAALYVLVIASSALMLQKNAGYVVAAMSAALFLVDLLVLREEAAHVGMAVQTALFVVVGIGAEAIARRLRAADSGGDALAARLVKVQLEAADILRTIRSGIITIDAEGRLLYANPAASDLLGARLRGLLGRPVLPLLNAIAPELAALLGRSARDGERVTRAEARIHRDEEIVSIGVTTTTIEADDDGRPQTATAIFQDISDTKRVQELHVRTERLQAVAALSASLAHEIRNPLASIRSASEQLSTRHAVRSTADEDELTLHSLIVREADRLDRLLGEFLDFARTRVTRTSPIDLANVIETAVAAAAAHPARSAEVAIHTRCEPRLFVEGDEDLLHRALFNLVLNAIQSFGSEGTGSVEVVAIADAASGIRITVTDNGPGVPVEVRERLFDPFVTGRSGGSGLGLSVVHRAAEAHDGAVYVDHLDGGTRFTILLPATVAPSEDVFGDVSEDVFPEIPVAEFIHETELQRSDVVEAL